MEVLQVENGFLSHISFFFCFYERRPSSRGLHQNVHSTLHILQRDNFAGES